MGAGWRVGKGVARIWVMAILAAPLAGRIGVQEVNMQHHTFRVSPELTLRIAKSADRLDVYVEAFVGVDFENTIEQRKPTTAWLLSKSEARTIASAIMGCAAEL